MRIIEVTVKNHGPFRNICAQFDPEGISIVEGPQGAGKTSLSRAIKWGLIKGEASKPKTNYTDYYNEEARKEKEEDMSVEIKFKEDDQIYTLEREIKRFDHKREQAYSKVTLSWSKKTIKGEEAQNKIDEFIHPSLSDFFFLDGEEIRSTVEKGGGGEIKEKIEKILKHRAVINAEEDLKKVRNKYERKRDELQEERDEFKEKKEEKDDKKKELKNKEKEKKKILEDIEETEKSIEETNKLLDEIGREKVNTISDLQSDISTKKSELKKSLKKIKNSWSHLDQIILSSEIDKSLEDIEEEINRKENKIKDIRDYKRYKELKEEAKSKGKCPICKQSVKKIRIEEKTKEDRNLSKIEKEKAFLEDKKEALKNILKEVEETKKPYQYYSQVDKQEEKIEDLKNDLDNELESTSGGEQSDEDKLKKNLKELREEKEDLVVEKKTVEGKIKELDKDIKKLDKEMSKLGGKELEKTEKRIRKIKKFIKYMQDIRERHIERKKALIQSKINEIFSKVAQSEIIDSKYKKIEFSEEEKEEYDLRFIKSNGEPRKMKNHKPSEGEMQILALSLVFGLAEYADYSNTIIFDTVSGRLDKINTQSQGELLADIDEPLILLVTDSELEEMGSKLQNNISKHYKLKGKDLDNSIIEEEVI